MCGIFSCLCIAPDICQTSDQNHANGSKSNPTDEMENMLHDSVLDQRGPDVSQEFPLPFATQKVNGWMKGCVLHLRGHLTPQPLIDDQGNALLWNGEIFDGIEVSPEENDTQILLKHLRNCETDVDILKTIEQVQGPWAFIYWQAKRKRLWFGRDVFGRRSLLWHLPADPSGLLVLSSVAVGSLTYTEVPSVGIYAIDLSAVDDASLEPSPPTALLPAITIYPWCQARWPGSAQAVLATQQEELALYLTPNQTPSILPVRVDDQQILKSWIPEICKTLSTQNECSGQGQKPSDAVDLMKCLEKAYHENERLRTLSEELAAVLLEAVRRRVNNLPVDEKPVKKDDSDDLKISRAKIAVLFSGGLDSSVIAALLDRCLPPEEPIDLLNVAFEQPPPSSKVKQKPKKYRKKKSGLNQENGASSLNQEISDSATSTSTQGETRAIEPSTLSHRSSDGAASSASERQHSQVLKSDCRNNSNLLPSDSVIREDSFSAKCSVQESFASPLSSQEQIHDPYDVPDRRTGRIALSELNPQRRWNFIEINVSQEELQALRSSRVARLIYPLQTVLDDSIGCAVWFAARGRGRLANHGGDDIVSRAKVILCGMAADEQFAGYSRHRAHFNQWGEGSLVTQLEQELWRISARNLGRDDRIIADHGKEARFPFLDEKFTEFVSKIPVHVRANLQLPRGVGEKLLLRLSAWSLQLRQTACQPKRAIQFGSKIAKLDDSKEKGSDICQRLL